MNRNKPEKIRLGISSCLLGEKVRYDGGTQQDRFITDTLGRFVDFLPVCPEVECGLSVPREAMRLVGDPKKPRLTTRHSKIDHTERMRKWAAVRVVELEREDLDGFIFKSRSPSSGMERVKVYREDERVTKDGVGIFARAFMEHFTLLPVEDEGRLHDIHQRENFIERIFVYKRWRELLANNKTRQGLVVFHTNHKLLFMAHSITHYRAMGKNVAQAREFSDRELFARYGNLLMEAMRLKTTLKKNVNVLMHMMGYFKKHLTGEEKRELLEIIDHYRMGYIPLIVPVTLFNHYTRKYDERYLAGQYYLKPHPLEMKLRNHA